MLALDGTLLEVILGANVLDAAVVSSVICLAPNGALRFLLLVLCWWCCCGVAPAPGEELLVEAAAESWWWSCHEGGSVGDDSAVACDLRGLDMSSVAAAGVRHSGTNCCSTCSGLVLVTSSYM